MKKELGRVAVAAPATVGECTASMHGTIEACPGSALNAGLTTPTAHRAANLDAFGGPKSRSASPWSCVVRYALS